MSLDKSQLETVTLNETSTGPLNETTLPQQPQLAGQVLDERYAIEEELGQGGVGAVFLARDRKLHDKRVVIKVLLDKSLQNACCLFGAQRADIQPQVRSRSNSTLPKPASR